MFGDIVNGITNGITVLNNGYNTYNSARYGSKEVINMKDRWFGNNDERKKASELIDAQNKCGRKIYWTYLKNKLSKYVLIIFAVWLVILLFTVFLINSPRTPDTVKVISPFIGFALICFSTFIWGTYINYDTIRYVNPATLRMHDVNISDSNYEERLEEIKTCDYNISNEKRNSN